MNKTRRWVSKQALLLLTQNINQKVMSLILFTSLSEQTQVHIGDCGRREGIFNEKTHVKGNRQYVSVTSYIIVSEFDGIIDVINRFVLEYGAQTFCLSAFRLNFYHRAFALEPHKEI